MSVGLIWFRQDLRLEDNLALYEACKHEKILPVFILSEHENPAFNIGAASKVWLHHSLLKLTNELHINFYNGKVKEIIEKLLQKHPDINIYYNKAYDEYSLKIEKEINDLAVQYNINTTAFNSNYLFEPKDILNENGKQYKVYTAFKNKALTHKIRAQTPIPKLPEIIQDSFVTVDELKLLPIHNWHNKITQHNQIGEQAANEKLYIFSKHKLVDYKEKRNYPALQHTSNLSAHLHFGEISPVQIFHHIQNTQAPKEDKDHFISEIVWREFCNYLIFHFPKSHSENIITKFNIYPWENNPHLLAAWQKGQTGCPIVDAGMRELWETGQMHNRVRMIVASFLIKNLNIHWIHGRDWFWDCLVDADIHNNSCGWQWVAGTGMDAAPYFRIFNPILQGEKFDPDGDYVKKYVPELANLPIKYIHKPWEANPEVLLKAGVHLGKNYPNLIVNLKQTRELALKRFKNLAQI